MADSGRNKDKKKKSNSTHRDCAWCRAQESLLHSIPKHYACARCKITFYCSVQCQKRHWKEGGHKRHCFAPEQRKVVATIKTSAVSVTGSEAIAAPEGSPKNCCGDKISALTHHILLPQLPGFLYRSAIHNTIISHCRPLRRPRPLLHPQRTLPYHLLA